MTGTNWSKHADAAETDRFVGLREIPAGDEFERTIASSRVTIVDASTQLFYRVESGLEAGALLNYIRRHDVKSIKAQHGPLAITVEGRKREHTFDFFITFENGVRVLVAVKPKGRKAAELDVLLEQFRNHLSKLGADYIVLLTDDEISKAVVKMAGEMVRSREIKNVEHTAEVYKRLLAAGRSIPVYELFDAVPRMMLADIWTSVCALMDEGLVEHDHAAPEKESFSWLSLICAKKEGD
ncbi:hypothetical protein ELG88_08395 [Rhizobium leguminosarum]|uniref:hypothetical protein n=1 Tax=Rhizobium leguminosarum TaxID=384 RepID=UPI0010325087|nr:hypothetical protein [Rhizobium leguminosarum]TBF35233.1 hypothetical protein ELG88_08395 [Rhizobium leguminosarum]